jgi:hypothetical protein
MKMTLNASKPADTDLVSTLGMYERETRAALNVLEAAMALLGAVATVSRVECTGGQTTLVIGTDLTAIPYEVVLISGTGLAALTDITSGTEGQMKFFIMLDSNVSFVRDVSKIALNQPAVVTSYGNNTGDVICLSNINGNGSTINGYWKELFRAPITY